MFIVLYLVSKLGFNKSRDILLWIVMVYGKHLQGMLLIFSHEHHFGEAVWTIGMAQAMELDLTWMFMKVRYSVTGSSSFMTVNYLIVVLPWNV
jgi:hypothetical protein